MHITDKCKLNPRFFTKHFGIKNIMQKYGYITREFQRRPVWGIEKLTNVNIMPNPIYLVRCLTLSGSL